MFDLFNKLVNRAKTLNIPALKNPPKIEWIKCVEDYATTAFAASFSRTAAGRIAGYDIIMKAEDGRFFTRQKWDKQPVWHTSENGNNKTYYAPALDKALKTALNQGLKTQPAAYTIFSQNMGVHSMRHFIAMNGTDEQFARVDEEYPMIPSGFTDYHTPEDYDEKNPHFANFLRRKSYVPFYLDEKRNTAPEQNPKP